MIHIIKKTKIEGAKTLSPVEMNKIHFDTGQHTTVDMLRKPAQQNAT